MTATPAGTTPSAAAPATTGPMTLPRFLLALGVVFIWGVNFVVIRIGLDHLPPLLFAALRFTLVFAPACLFVRPPKGVPWRDLVAYGVLIGAGQFGLLFIAMRGMISPGLASLVVQTQVFFTIGLSMLISRETLRPHQFVAVGLSAAGLVLIAVNAGGSVTPLGLVLVLGAGLSWAGGNMVAKRSPGANMLAYVVWGGLFGALPLYAASLALEGWTSMRDGVLHATAATWAAVLWQSVGNSLFGYAAWGWLLNRHPAATVVPLALLVPVFGLGASALVLGEALEPWKLAATALVLGGLAFNLLWGRVRRAPSKS
jgi:O-acetylserine/cysteine efflux transporter